MNIMQTTTFCSGLSNPPTSSFDWSFPFLKFAFWKRSSGGSGSLAKLHLASHFVSRTPTRNSRPIDRLLFPSSSHLPATTLTSQSSSRSSRYTRSIYITRRCCTCHAEQHSIGCCSNNNNLSNLNDCCHHQSYNRLRQQNKKKKVRRFFSIRFCETTIQVSILSSSPPGHYDAPSSTTGAPRVSLFHSASHAVPSGRSILSTSTTTTQ